MIDILSGNRKNLNLFSSKMVKTICIKTICTALVMIFLTSNAGAIDINACTHINSPGVYVLSQDITTNSDLFCININSNDVVFDGNGFSINGNGNIGVSIPFVNNSMPPQNVTVKNLKITGWNQGIMVRGQYHKIFGNNISNNNYGIIVVDSNNQIYNNYFDNVINVFDYGINSWNTTKQAGPNIIGGPYIGGNYWSDYIGNDTNGDGLGDEFIPHNNDFLPLTKEKVTGVVNPGDTVTTDPEGSGPTDSDIVETSITIPNSGSGTTTISIEETSATQYPPEGYFLIGQEISISSTETYSTTDPLIINFTVDSTLIPLGQMDLDSIIVYRNDEEVGDCTSTNPIIPDPCIFERVILPSGDGRITVYTSAASKWGLFKKITPAEDINIIIDKVEDLNLQKGIDNSLDAKLDSARNALQDVNERNNAAAINSLEAFINAVEAQRGKLIDDSNADTLIEKAQLIIAGLG